MKNSWKSQDINLMSVFWHVLRSLLFHATKIILDIVPTHRRVQFVHIVYRYIHMSCNPFSDRVHGAPKINLCKKNSAPNISCLQ